ncbi:GNAT family N-acetyltransferase [Actinoallomurus purpureus]|uniref:GNAT family N-acetyltransferase n=1 Tax=Actinoallomurus purpureus TaxID=478114 RepID=UPI0020932BC9|nr:GNAT family N-acetyltransferase [Actinoallomurus purpureus]MCO6004515.1 GNAT family N-acetyltransferase [Actinoallomurus purpureus]
MIIRTARAEEAARLAPYLPVTHAVLDGDRLTGGLSLIETRPGVRDLSIWVIPEERRRGVASKAVRTLTEQADGRLEMVTDVADVVSQRVALNAGFTREAVRRGSGPAAGGRPDEIVWAWLPGDPPGPAARLFPDLAGGELRDGEVSVRPQGPADVDDLLALMNLPDVRARAASSHERSRAEVARRCEHAASEWLAGNRADFTIRVNGEFAGDIGLYNEVWSRSAMLGYSMLPAFRRQGVVTRAVRLVSAWAFEIGVQRLAAGTAPDNTASQRVLEKAGFIREGVQWSRMDGPDGTRVDDVVYVLLP